jgi:diamine N-acetyltransferase
MPVTKEYILDIREITTQEEMERSVTIVRESFQTVAREFGFTQKTNPTHPSFMQLQHMEELKSYGTHLFGLFQRGQQCGFVVVGPSTDRVYNVEKLAVIPACRHLGYGEALIKYVQGYAVAKNASKVTLAMINEHTVLKDWYLRQGFNEASLKKFPHLPFTVCYMEQEV